MRIRLEATSVGIGTEKAVERTGIEKFTSTLWTVGQPWLRHCIKRGTSQLYIETQIGGTNTTTAGLKITAGRSPVKMTGQLDFSSVKICF